MEIRVLITECINYLNSFQLSSIFQMNGLFQTYSLPFEIALGDSVMQILNFYILMGQR